MSGFGGIRAVTFDVGGTLIDPWPSVGHVYAEVAARHGVRNVSAVELDRRFERAFRARRLSPQTAAEWAEVVDETFAGLTVERPSRTFFGELYERFSEATAWRIYEDVLPTISALGRRGIKLGVVSNWDERLRPLLERLDLIRHFEAVLVSIEVGCRKPAPEIFHRAAALLDLQPQAILHVGDSEREDLAGAHAAGFKAVLVDRKNSGVGRQRISSLTDLLEMLD